MLAAFMKSLQEGHVWPCPQPCDGLRLGAMPNLFKPGQPSLGIRKRVGTHVGQLQIVHVCLECVAWLACHVP